MFIYKTDGYNTNEGDFEHSLNVFFLMKLNFYCSNKSLFYTRDFLVAFILRLKLNMTMHT